MDLMLPLLSLSALCYLSLSLSKYFDAVCAAADLRGVGESLPMLETCDLYICRHPERLGGLLDETTHFA